MRVLMDLFDGKILRYTFLPLLLSLGFWGVVFLVFGDEIIHWLASYALSFPFGEKISKLIESGGFLVLIVLYYLLTISTLGIFSSFFIDKIVLRINEKHFNCKERQTSFKDTLYGIFVSIKSFLIYAILSLFTFWMLFIPVVNIFYQMVMWTILNKKPLVFDSSYLFFDPREIEKELGIKAWVVVFLTSVVYFVPVISWFGYTIQLIFFSHMVLKKCKT